MLALNYSGWDTELSLELRSSGPIQIPRFAQGRLTAGARLHMGIAPPHETSPAQAGDL